MTDEAVQGFQSQSVSHLTGLSSRTLYEWDKQGIYHPSVAEARGRGTLRLYSQEDILILKALNELYLAGVAPSKLKGVIRFFSKHLEHVAAVSRTPELVLITDGQQFHAFCLGMAEVSATLLAHTGTTLIVIKFGEVTGPILAQLALTKRAAEAC